nr:hypothetical protein [Candidatus Sigynarchaeum springense]
MEMKGMEWRSSTKKNEMTAARGKTSVRLWFHVRVILRDLVQELDEAIRRISWHVVADIVDLKDEMVVNTVFRFYYEFATEIGGQHDFLHGNRACGGYLSFPDVPQFVYQHFDNPPNKAADVMLPMLSPRGIR